MADYVSVLTGGTNNFATTSEHLNSLATDILSDGVVGAVYNTAGVAPMTGGLAVNAQGTPNMTVAVTAGKAYITATPSGQASQRLRANIAAQNVTISSNSTGGTRYDWVYVKIDAANAANPNAAGDNVATLVTSRSTSASTDNGTPPTYGYCIAVVTVSNGATSIVNGNIADKRSASSVPSNTASDGWASLSAAPNTVTYNGNRNYDLVFNSVDLSGTLSPGQKLKLTRTVAAPYRSTTLNGTSQYYSKTSPAGFSGMTSAFTAMAWVKLLSYPSANAGAIIGRDSAGGANSGWELEIDGGGRAIIYARNATGNIVGTSYTAVPLNKWIHIAASLNAATGATAIYFDGVLQSSISATAGTTIVQPTTDLTIGKRNSGAYYLNAELAQVAVFSSVLNQATIRSYISQGLSGSESSLVSAFSFDGSKNDLNTTNANNLTANGSAVETTADSPYANSITAGLQEYAEINSVSYSTNTTVNVRVPETCMIPTSGGITSSSYSTQANPYGLPAFSNIIAMAIYSNNFSSSSNSRIELTGLKTTAIIPPNKSVRISAFTRALAGTAGDIISFEIHDGSVSGTTNMITGADNCITTGGTGPSVYIETVEKPNTSTTANITKTYVVGTINNTAARSFIVGGDITSTYRRPLFIKVELV